MEENNYNKFNRPKFFKRPEISSEEFHVSLSSILIDIENGAVVDSNEILSSYCFELKNILKNNGPKECLEHFFKLEDLVSKLDSQNRFNENFPNLLEFHRSFSSTVLRIFWECIASNEMDALSLKFLEAFRIAIEEELYIWQEKIH